MASFSWVTRLTYCLIWYHNLLSNKKPCEIRAFNAEYVCESWKQIIARIHTGIQKIPEVKQLQKQHVHGNACTLDTSGPWIVDIGHKPGLTTHSLSSGPASWTISSVCVSQNMAHLFPLPVNPFPHCPLVELILYKSAYTPDICLEASRIPWPAVGHCSYWLSQPFAHALSTPCCHYLHTTPWTWTVLLVDHELFKCKYFYFQGLDSN